MKEGTHAQSPTQEKHWNRVERKGETEKGKCVEFVCLEGMATQRFWLAGQPLHPWPPTESRLACACQQSQRFDRGCHFRLFSTGGSLPFQIILIDVWGKLDLAHSSYLHIVSIWRRLKSYFLEVVLEQQVCYSVHCSICLSWGFVQKVSTLDVRSNCSLIRHNLCVLLNVLSFLPQPLHIFSWNMLWHEIDDCLAHCVVLSFYFSILFLGWESHVGVGRYKLFIWPLKLFIIFSFQVHRGWQK